MKEVYGADIFHYAKTNRLGVILVTTNGIVKTDGRAVMGAGIAKQVRDRWAGIDKELGDRIIIGGNKPYILGIYNIEDHLVLICSFPTKHHWKDNSDMQLIENSASLINEISKKDYSEWFEKGVITVPAGCGNGGLRWEYVKKVIEPHFDDRFTVCFPQK